MSKNSTPIGIVFFIETYTPFPTSRPQMSALLFPAAAFVAFYVGLFYLLCFRGLHRGCFHVPFGLALRAVVAALFARGSRLLALLWGATLL